MFVFLLSAVFSHSEETALNGTAGEASAAAGVIVTIQEEEFDVGASQEARIPVRTVPQEVILKFMDERILRVQQDAQEEILAVIEEINQLEDKSAEPELQKEIERIKLDAEIARLKIYMQDAEEKEKFELADEFSDHIDYLENLNEPVVGIPAEQPRP
jgi:hypothetical protein